MFSAHGFHKHSNLASASRYMRVALQCRLHQESAREANPSPGLLQNHTLKTLAPHSGCIHNCWTDRRSFGVGVWGGLGALELLTKDRELRSSSGKSPPAVGSTPSTKIEDLRSAQELLRVSLTQIEHGYGRVGTGDGKTDRQTNSLLPTFLALGPFSDPGAYMWARFL